MNKDALLAAISETSPCGDDLSFSPEFDQIQKLRHADDPTLDQGEWVSALKLADWPGVVAACEDILAVRSKDLRVAAWLTEATAHNNGFGGLADGIELCSALCDRYWDRLHPLIEDGDADQRDGTLRWLLSKVEGLTPQLPMLKKGDQGLSLRDIELAQAKARSVERGGDALPAAGSQAADDLAAALRETPRAVLEANVANLQRGRLALADLERLVDTHLGADGPGFTAARTALEDAAHAAERLARPAGAAQLSTVAVDRPVSPPPQDLRIGHDETLATRAQALQQLRAVADFFRRTEPHSPVAYLAERAATWGEMPLHDWLRTVVKDEGVLANMQELLGVPHAAPAAE